jgi:hypothetical protein
MALGFPGFLHGLAGAGWIRLLMKSQVRNPVTQEGVAEEPIHAGFAA